MTQGPVEGATLLLVDDDEQLTSLVTLVLENSGYRVRVARRADEVLGLVEGGEVHLVLLDIGLGADDGRAILARIREVSDLPVIMISGQGDVADRVLGLRLGADDYLPKPFAPVELEARIDAVLRRRRLEDRLIPADQPSGDPVAVTAVADAGSPATAPAPPTPGVAAAAAVEDTLTIDEATREVSVGGRAVTLTAREFDLLAFLARSPRQVFTRSQILDHVWDSRSEWQDEATVTEHVRRVRRKIEPDPDRPRWITTVRGVGYRYEP